jgi:hypothetical protein
MRAVLQTLVVRQEQRRAVAEAVLLEDSAQPGALASRHSGLVEWWALRHRTPPLVAWSICSQFQIQMRLG